MAELTQEEMDNKTEYFMGKAFISKENVKNILTLERKRIIEGITEEINKEYDNFAFDEHMPYDYLITLIKKVVDLK